MPRILFPPLIIILIIFSCLAYGSVSTVPVTIIELIVALMVLSWLSGMLFKNTLAIAKTPLYLPLFLFLALIIFQLIPLPAALMKFISGHTAYLYAKLTPAQTPSSFFTLSIYPGATLSELFKVLTYIGIFILVINNLETKKEFDIIINALIFFGLAISLFGIMQKYTYTGKVYWFDADGTAANPLGPFIYRNNFAAYINLIIPLALGYALTNMPLAKRIIYGFCAGVMALALFLSLSRAGILVFLAVLIFLLLFSRLKAGLKTKTRTLSVGLFSVFILFIFFMEAKVVWERLSTLFKKEAFAVFGHGYSWFDILRIWGDFPLFGTGLGTFGSISAMYKTTGTQSAFTYAHNDYLQLLSEVGLTGFILVALFFVLYFNSAIKLWLERHDSYVVCLVLGGLASIFGILVYSLLDFNLHIPAVALLFFLILGLTYRLAALKFEHGISQ